MLRLSGTFFTPNYDLIKQEIQIQNQIKQLVDKV
jgi:hypothetical protein